MNEQITIAKGSLAKLLSESMKSVQLEIAALQQKIGDLEEELEEQRTLYFQL